MENLLEKDKNEHKNSQKNKGNNTSNISARLSESKINEYKERYKKYINSEGKVTYKELIKYYKDKALKLNENDAKALIQKYDNNSINVEDFVSIIRSYRFPDKNTTIMDNTMISNKRMDETITTNKKMDETMTIRKKNDETMTINKIVDETMTVNRRMDENSIANKTILNKSIQYSDPIIRSFKFLDIKNNGKLNTNTFKYLLTNYGNKFTNEQVKFLFEYLKIEGKVDFDYTDFVENLKKKANDISN